MALLDKIRGPEDLKALSIKRAGDPVRGNTAVDYPDSPAATAVILRLIWVVVELTVALHYVLASAGG